MVARILSAIAKPAYLYKLGLGKNARFRRRAAVAFVTGAALFVSSAVAMIAEGALAHGPQTLRMVAGDSSSGGDVIRLVDFEPERSDPAYAPYDSSARFRHLSTAVRLFSSRVRGKMAPAPYVGSRTGGQAVCVRLCDGFFFPTSAASNASAMGEQASCDSLCPDAPTALFYEPQGSDRIEDAVSSTGQRYTALPVSLRYRSTQDNTCTCHRSVAGVLSPLADGTLRRGDAVMTPRGFLVFRGAEQSTHSRADFTPLQSAALPLAKDQRTALQALERVSVAPRQAGLAAAWAWVTAQGPSPRAPTTLAAAFTTAVPSRNGEVSVIRFVQSPASAN